MGNDQYKGAKVYQPEGKNTTPFNDLLKEYDDYMGERTKERNKWRSVAFMLIAIIAAQGLGWVYAISLPKVKLHVIEIAPWGEAKNVGAIGETGTKINIPDKAKIYAMRRVIEQTRSIPLDQAVLVKNLEQAYQLLTSKTAAIMTEQLQGENIYKLFGSLRREVFIESIINVTGNAWQIDWVEKDYSLVDAKEIATRRTRAIVTLVQGEPGTSVTTANPLGIYIDSYQKQVLGGD